MSTESRSKLRRGPLGGIVTVTSASIAGMWPLARRRRVLKAMALRHGWDEPI